MADHHRALLLQIPECVIGDVREALHRERLIQATSDTNEALQNVAVDGVENLESGLEGLISGTESVSSAFKKMASAIRNFGSCRILAG